jgi:ABC-type transporter Mla subunit MlaD
MQSTTHGTRDGILFLVGLLLLILVIVSLTNMAQDQDMYSFMIRYSKAQSIASGAMVQVSGVPVGRVAAVSLQPETNMSLVTVKVYDNVKLRTTDSYGIGTGGLVGERYIDITPEQASGQRVKAGMIVAGVSSPDVNDLFAATGNLLAKLDATASGINGLLGDTETIGHLKEAITNLEIASAASAELSTGLNTQFKANRGELLATVADLRATTRASSEITTGLSHLLQQHQSDLGATLVGLRQTSTSSAAMVEGLNGLVQRNAQAVDLMVADLGAVSKDIRLISATLTPQVAGTKMVQNLDAASENVAKLTKRLENAAAAVDLLLNDKELAATLRDSAAHMRKASGDLELMMADARKAVASIPGMTTDLQAASASMKEAMANMKDASAGMKSASGDLPYITRPFREIAPKTAENVLDISSSLRRTSADVNNTVARLNRIGTGLANIRLRPEGRYVVLANGPQHARTDVNLDVRGASRLLRLGVANIDHGNHLNVQLGNQLRPDLWVRYGAVQSTAGLGFDYLPHRNVRLTSELFDARSARANFQADYRLGGNWWLTAGWYDAFDARGTAGGGIAYHP